MSDTLDLKIAFRIDGKDYIAGPILAADIIALERAYDIAGGALFDSPKIEWLLFVGVHALARLGGDKLDMATVVETVETCKLIVPDGLLEELENEGKGVGLNRAARRASSRRSSASSESRGKPSRRSTTGS